MKEPCLGAYGGPVAPNIALGGFNGTAYQNATTLIITFVVNNHKDKSKLGKALAWEKAFLEYMKSYENENLAISFSAERSIQDELDRESNTDIVTILVSYLIMFLYITVALGQFTDCNRIMVNRVSGLSVQKAAKLENLLMIIIFSGMQRSRYVKDIHVDLHKIIQCRLVQTRSLKEAF